MEYYNNYAVSLVSIATFPAVKIFSHQSNKGHCIKGMELCPNSSLLIFVGNFHPQTSCFQVGNQIKALNSISFTNFSVLKLLRILLLPLITKMEYGQVWQCNRQKMICSGLFVTSFFCQLEEFEDRTPLYVVWFKSLMYPPNP